MADQGTKNTLITTKETASVPKQEANQSLDNATQKSALQKNDPIPQTVKDSPVVKKAIIDMQKGIPASKGSGKDRTKLPTKENNVSLPNKQHELVKNH